ncbi:CsbD family protein [Streptomyces sp.]|uniref:CsbD family protein n=1 Tax=Streptomyces sp. TaxID=1931 RepID=UPI002D6B39EC|nr:CsbD family protein [Streptomyces sp.]HZF92240.1 CsbD family protein [Streptomyces sp.]
MARNQKAKAKMEQVKGKTKESTARAVGNESKTGEGRMEKTKGDLRQAKEKAKDAFRE